MIITAGGVTCNSLLISPYHKLLHAPQLEIVQAHFKIVQSHFPVLAS